MVRKNFVSVRDMHSASKTIIFVLVPLSFVVVCVPFYPNIVHPLFVTLLSVLLLIAIRIVVQPDAVLCWLSPFFYIVCFFSLGLNEHSRCSAFSIILCLFVQIGLKTCYIWPFIVEFLSPESDHDEASN